MEELKEKVKYCSECGTKINTISKYCSNCGKEITNNVNIQSKEPKKQNQTSSLASAIIGIIAFVIVLIFIYSKISSTFNELFISKDSYVLDNNIEITKDIYNISEEIYSSVETLTVNSISYAYSKDNVFKPETGKKYAIVNVTVKNINDYDRTINLSSFKLIKSNGEKIPALIAIDDSDINHHTLVPGGHITGDIYFEVDEYEHNLKLSYTSGIFNEKFDVVVDVSR